MLQVAPTANGTKSILELRKQHYLLSFLVEQFMRNWVNIQQNNWSTYIALAEFAHNSWRNESTQRSPFMTLMGYNPRTEITSTISTITRVNSRLDEIREARIQAQEAMKKAQLSWDKRKRPERQFKEGDQVWLDGR